MISRLKAVLIIFTALSLFLIVTSILATILHPASFTASIYKIYSLICHQHQELCIKVNGNPMPLCSRCVGLYTGALLTNLFALLFIFKRPEKTIRLIFSRGRIISFATAVFWGLIFLDSRLTDIGILSISHIRRFSLGITGGVFSALFILFLFSLFFSLLSDQQKPDMHSNF